MKLTDLTIKSINEIPALVARASLAEVDAEPKIGNIGPNQNFSSTSYSDFVRSIQALESETAMYLQGLDEHYKGRALESLTFSSYGIGDFYQGAVDAMMDAQSGGNTILGHILLYGPLITTLYFFLSCPRDSPSDFWMLNEQILSKTTSDDCIKLYQAIRRANPGGLGSSQQLDVNNDHSFSEFRQNSYTLPEVFALNQDRDFVGEQIAQNYAFIRNFCLPSLAEAHARYSTLNEAILFLFLKILTNKGDSLILRKNGRERSDFVQNAAQNILDLKPFSPKGLQAITQLNHTLLQAPKNRLNPGSTADLVACTLFCHYLGSKF